MRNAITKRQEIVTEKPIPWRQIRDEYIQGSDEVTYAALSRALSHEPGAPNANAIRQRAHRENWKQKRADFRAGIRKEMEPVTVDKIIKYAESKIDATEADADRLVDLIGMLERKVKQANQLRNWAITGIRSLHPEEQKLGDLVKLLQLAESIEDKIIDREFLAHLESIRNEV